MSSKQLPLPGMEGYVIADKLDRMSLIYFAHVGLEDHLKTIFDNEIVVLRAMSTMSDKECPENLYIQQRKFCLAIRDLVGMLEDMSDEMEKSDSGE